MGRDSGEERGLEALHFSLSDARFLVLTVERRLSGQL